MHDVSTDVGKIMSLTSLPLSRSSGYKGEAPNPSSYSFILDSTIAEYVDTYARPPFRSCVAVRRAFKDMWRSSLIPTPLNVTPNSKSLVPSEEIPNGTPTAKRRPTPSVIYLN